LSCQPKGRRAAEPKGGRKIHEHKKEDRPGGGRPKKEESEIRVGMKERNLIKGGRPELKKG